MANTKPKTLLHDDLLFAATITVMAEERRGGGRGEGGGRDRAHISTDKGSTTDNRRHCIYSARPRDTPTTRQIDCVITLIK